MLAGLCINIPMLRPFYLRWRKDSKASKSSRMGGSDEVGSNGTTGHLASPRGKNLNDHNTWIELVRANLSLPSPLPLYQSNRWTAES